MPRHDPHSYADLAQGRLRHIAFQLQADFSRRLLHGTAHYHLDHAVDGPLDLDTRDLEIHSITADGRGVPFALGKADPILGSRLRLTNLDGAREFTIAFTTGPRARALQWLTPAQTAGGRQPYLFTQCQPHHARTIFPCQDSPSVRFTYEAEFRVPTPLVAVMAAAPLGSAREGALTVFRFNMPQPIPSYLFALAAGDLVSRDLGSRSRVYAEPEVVEGAAWEFARIEAMLTEAERLYGPYPWERYDMLVLPPSFPYGGMENARLTFLTPTMIVGDRSLTNLLAHELAHSWTGNLVTNATWEDFWLNEGWTTYAERRILGALEGEDSAMLRAATGRNAMFHDMRRLGWTSDPTRLKFRQAGLDPEPLMSTIAYEKGYAFLVRLERIVGRPAFDVFTLRYIAEHRFQTVTTEAFVDLLRRDLPQVFDEVDVHAWLYDPGFRDDAPSLDSALVDDVASRLFDYQEGRLPKRPQVAGWNTAQIYLFLQHLPRVIPLDDCRALEAAFALDRTRVPYFLSHFLEIAVRSGMREALPRAEELVSTVGRIFITRPVFQAIAETEWCRPRARPLLERIRPRLHPITISELERVAAKAGA